MSRKAWVAFVLVQLFGDLGPWAGLRMKSSLGPALWVAGIVVMMPGRLLALFITESKPLWNAPLTPVQMTAVFVVIETAANVCFWLLCARCWRFVRRRRAIPVRSEP
jgi:hypothetical protein